MSDQVLTRRDRCGPLRRDRLGKRQVTRELARSLHRLERTKALTKAHLHGLSAFNDYATSKATTTVAKAQASMSAAGRSGQLPVETHAEFLRLTQAYLAGVSRITEEVGLAAMERLREELVNG